MIYDLNFGFRVLNFFCLILNSDYLGGKSSEFLLKFYLNLSAFSEKRQSNSKKFRKKEKNKYTGAPVVGTPILWTHYIVSCDAEVCGAERESSRTIQGRMH